MIVTKDDYNGSVTGYWLEFIEKSTVQLNSYIELDKNLFDELFHLYLNDTKPYEKTVKELNKIKNSAGVELRGI